MSFRFQRLSNKLFNSKFPTTSYEFHNSFVKKRGLKEEAWTPTLSSQESQEIFNEIPREVPKLSNWRVTKERTTYSSEDQIIYMRNTMWCIIVYLLFAEYKRCSNRYDRAHGSKSAGDIGSEGLHDELE